MFDRTLCLARMGEENLTLCNRDMRRYRRAILARPRIDIFKKRLMGLKPIFVGELIDLRQVRNRIIQLVEKGAMFELFVTSKTRDVTSKHVRCCLMMRHAVALGQCTNFSGSSVLSDLTIH